MDPSSLKALCFDVFGTVVDWRSSIIEECALVAAHNNDLAAARQLGFKTMFVTRPSEHGPGQTKDLTAERDWDVVARDFLDLADQLGC